MAADAEAAGAATLADAAAATVVVAPSVVCAAAPSVEDVYMAARSAHAEDAAVDVDAVDADGADAAAGESGGAAVCHGAAANPGANPRLLDASPCRRPCADSEGSRAL